VGTRSHFVYAEHLDEAAETSHPVAHRRRDFADGETTPRTLREVKAEAPGTVVLRVFRDLGALILSRLLQNWLRRRSVVMPMQARKECPKDLPHLRSNHLCRTFRSPLRCPLVLALLRDGRKDRVIRGAQVIRQNPSIQMISFHFTRCLEKFC
jgi:hypothetical protein